MKLHIDFTILKQELTKFNSQNRARSMRQSSAVMAEKNVGAAVKKSKAEKLEAALEKT
jgi:hypothetical protein